MTNTAKPTIRLFIPGDYTPGQSLALSKNQSHYLANVMRVQAGEALSVFNGIDGQWQASISSVDKKSVTLTLTARQMPHKPSPDIWLCFAPVKNKTDLVIEKATELGVSKAIAVFTQHSVVKSVNMEKLTAHAVEAAEQCERHDVPAIETARDLPSLLGAWPKDRILFYGDESGSGASLGDVIRSTLFSPRLRGESEGGDILGHPHLASPAGGGGIACGMLIGPEGGFSAYERQVLKAADFVRPFGMGPRILRADTAAVAALACLMMQVGDWQEKPHFKSAS